MVNSRLQEALVQQLVRRQVPDQVEAAEAADHGVQVRGGGATVREQHRHLRSTHLG